jgi:sugar lactone lactonase YvrE
MLRKLSTRVMLVVALVMLSAVVLMSGTSLTHAADGGCSTENTAWAGSFGYGAACIDDAGWHLYAEGKGQLQSNQVKDIAICADGTTWIANTLGLLKVDKSGESAVPIKSDIFSVEAIACDGKGGLWAAHFKGVSHFSDGNWETTESTKLGTGESTSLVKDVAVDAEGKVYVVTSNSVAVGSGSEWTIYEKGKGFDDELFFEKLTLDSSGKVYALHSSGFSVLEAGKWTHQKNDQLYSFTALALDSKGMVWIGSYSQGLHSFDGTGWKTYTLENDKLSSNHINDIAVDAQDRVWIGTEYGLSVFDGTAFTVYRMSNSDLIDNDVKAVVVSGKGPALPAVADKGTGSITGTVTNGSEPLASAKVQACTLFIGSSFTGDTPCGDQPDNAVATTDAEGKFVFDKLPVGHYRVVLEGTDGKWGILSDSFGIDSKVAVTEGKATDIGSIDLSKKK